MTTRPQHLYLSGPMTGWPDYNRPAFHSAAAVLRRAGYTVTNPAENGLPDTAEWADHMRADIALLAQHATGLAMLPEWRHSKGASLEHRIAVAIGLPCLPVYMWLDLKRALQPTTA